MNWLVALALLAVFAYACWQHKKEPHKVALQPNNKPEEDDITYHHFTGPNAKEEAARFLAGVDKRKIASVTGIDKHELSAETENQAILLSAYPSGKIEIDPRKMTKNLTIMIGDGANCIGYTFCAYLHMTTPTAFLKAHADFVVDEDFKFEDEGFGSWLPVFEHADRWGELSPAKRFGASAMAYEVLPLLLDMRDIIENNTDPKAIYTKLIHYQAMQRHRNDFLIQQYLSGKYKNLGAMWATLNLTAIRGIGVAKACKLIGQGIYTVEQYEGMSK